MAHRNVLNAVDTVLDLPSRATNVDASVHGPPVQGIVSAASGNHAQLVRRTSFFAKVRSFGLMGMPHAHQPTTLRGVSIACLGSILIEHDC